mmetsp:Transcript_49049/g.154011  ORF Transcript_49049/g.154011 Transcript_49049/m.154011 type:complete len:211 (+) Transcript_49049:1176-1808(+)
MLMSISDRPLQDSSMSPTCSWPDSAAGPPGTSFVTTKFALSSRVKPTPIPTSEAALLLLCPLLRLMAPNRLDEAAFRIEDEAAIVLERRLASLSFATGSPCATRTRETSWRLPSGPRCRRSFTSLPSGPLSSCVRAVVLRGPTGRSSTSRMMSFSKTSPLRRAGQPSLSFFTMWLPSLSRPSPIPIPAFLVTSTTQLPSMLAPPRRRMLP